MLNLIPIGVQCRTATQCRKYALSAFGVKVPSLPLDWTITTFNALRLVFDEVFNPRLVLNPRALSSNIVGSVTCNYSNIIFHHDFPPDLMATLGIPTGCGLIQPNIIPNQMIEEARERFGHTYQNFCKIVSGDLPAVFVRWKNISPADNTIFGYYHGEDSITLLSMLRRRRKDALLLTVETTAYEDSSIQVIDAPILWIENNEQGFLEVKIKERLGNGLTDFFYEGDTDAWSKMFAYCLPRLMGVRSH